MSSVPVGIVVDRLADQALPAYQARSRAMRDRIVTAARDVFANQGFGGAKIADIAAAAGCSTGVVYARFTDKDGLFRAVAGAYVHRARQALTTLEAARLRGTGPRLLRLFVTAVARAFQENRGLYRALLERGLEVPEVMAELVRLRDEAALALERLIAAPAGQEDRHRLRIRVASQMLYGFLINGVLNPQAIAKVTDDDVIDELANAIVGYLIGPERGSPVS